ncbi:YiiX/YebB-like N1pC/P60 family cysteine hydrolase [Tepidibacter aestuarii]|uniref:YiiX/YebB-like N1pC/P60 family cysteine hydrolase n=1 Tax=Tepidibacter aestuarii TaxID=2925782 RepID=UPI0020C0BFBA|nr:YiiX/YebB-like N1pC/P60 family cysteine hydrolase [Tepidibacter aestuarii]CAH2213511.1 Permuted papain-like amidase enzyme, YaeF/YiiX, C92 family [Tepidibacter aestuarii]
MGTSKFNGVNQISYEQAKKEIETGDILFCSGRYLVSELIKKASDSIFSHVGLLFYWNNRIVVLESVEDDGVRAVPLSHYLYNYENSKKKYNGELYVARHEVVASSHFDKEKIKRMLGKAVDLLNRNYDKDEIAQIVARIGLGIGRHRDNEEYICSEFVDECFKQLEIELSRDPKDFIYPEHIAADSNIRPLFEISP